MLRRPRVSSGVWARSVPPAAALDADDLGAEVGEDHRGERGRPEAGELDDAQPGEGAAGGGGGVGHGIHGATRATPADRHTGWRASQVCATYSKATTSGWPSATTDSRASAAVRDSRAAMAMPWQVARVWRDRA